MAPVYRTLMAGRQRGFRDGKRRMWIMTAPAEVVRELYSKLTAADASGALALMTDDVEWVPMMDYKVDGRGPQNVLEGMLIPAMTDG